MKKNAKRVFSAVIAASLTLSMGVAAFAEQHTNIIVKGGAGGSGSSVYVKLMKSHLQMLTRMTGSMTML